MNVKKLIRDIIGEDKIKALKILMEADKPEKFTEAKTKQGQVVTYEGESLQVGMQLFGMDAQGAKTPLPDGDYEMDDGSIVSVKDGLIVNIKKPEKAPEEQPMMRKFIEYLKSDSYKGESYKFEDYPWDECIADQKDAGVDDPEAVCAAIKNRTVKHLIEKKFVKDEMEAINMIGKSIKSNPVMAYLLNGIYNPAPKNKEEMKNQVSELKISLKKQSDEIESLKKVNKEIFLVIEKIIDLPLAAPVNIPPDKNNSSWDEMKEWRKKYITN